MISRPMSPEAKANAKARRDRHKSSLLTALDTFGRFGHEGADVDAIREQLACIEWLESRGDPRELDSGTMKEYRMREEE